MTRLPKYRIGQVVRINTEFYDTKRREQRFQEITHIGPWGKSSGCLDTEMQSDCACQSFSFEYTFANGDHCHEKFLKPLTKRQKGER